MSELLELSARVIDENVTDQTLNRRTMKLAEIADGIGLVESFGHIAAVRTDEGLVLFDTSARFAAAACLDGLREWSNERVHAVVYTHGHLDHVGGGPVLIAHVTERGEERPTFVAHRNVPQRFDRYELTDGYNLSVNARQFGGREQRQLGTQAAMVGRLDRFLPSDIVRPDLTYDDELTLTVGETTFELHHAKGETDDHTWTWVPEHKTLFCGDLFIWNFPNCGNPQKAQRYPREWAQALREMSTMGAELFVPQHGLPIAGAERINGVLTETAEALEDVVAAVLEMMNAGEPLDTILHTVDVPSERRERVFLRGLYDEPEFVVHNIWRLYGGWYTGDPSELKPAPKDVLASEVAELCGGASVLAKRALVLAEGGDLRLACHLAEIAGRAAPDDKEVHATRAEVYAKRRDVEASLMAKAIFADAANRSVEIAGTG